MSFILSHIEKIINNYSPPEPLHLALKKHYSANKQLGSRDRKAINEAVFLFFRLKNFSSSKNFLEILQFARTSGMLQNSFLMQAIPDVQLDKPQEMVWPESVPKLSDGFSEQLYLMSLMYQPRLFIRLLDSNYLPKLIDEFPDAEVYYLDGMDYPILNLPNGCQLERHLPAASYVVQDLSSQKALIKASEIIGSTAPKKIWDLCSGAGGKTLLAKALWPQAKILASDIRPQILRNLRLRVHQYGYKNVQTQVLDSSVELPKLSEKGVAGFPTFDLAICDVPCSGSGTWARTPEQIDFSDDLDLQNYQNKQIAIATNAALLLPKGSFLLYITCSVFYIENEESVAKIVKQEPSLKLLHQEFIPGIENASDSMFYAVFEKQ